MENGTENPVSKRTLIIISIITALTILLVLIITLTTVSNEGCIIDIKEDFNQNSSHPLLLLKNSTFFLQPNNGSKIVLSGGESFRLACPGENNYLSVDGGALVEATCAFNKSFFVNGGLYTFKELECVNFTEPSVEISEIKCAQKHTLTEIGFDTSAGFVPLITTCFDNNTKDSLYSRHNLSSKINNAETTSNRNFIQGNFYPNLELDTLYKLTSEKQVFQKLVGAPIDQYINNNNYFNKGHLAPNGDFIYNSQKRATYFYLNIAPQWLKFNSGNWNKLEQNCRDYAGKNNLDLIIYTGIHGTATLPDKSGKQHDLSLYYDNNKVKFLTVPNVFWKVLYDPISKNGVVFISHNNPYENKGQRPKQLCTNVCNKIKWLSWKPDDLKLGYSYCCEFTQAKKIITYLPDLPIENILV